MSFKSAKSIADSTGDDESFARSKSTNAFNVAANSNSRLLRSQNTVKNLLSYQTAQRRSSQSIQTRRDERVEFVAQVHRIRKQLQTMHRWTISPNSRFVRYWDFVTLTALMITIFITPWEVSFLPPTRLASDDWSERPITFVVNRCVDTVFVIDVVLAFFLPFRTTRTGMWVYDKKRIVRNYLCGWFALDVVTCIPFDVVFGLIAQAFNWNVQGGSNALTFRLLRMLRIMKLARIVRASRIISRWQDHIGMSYAYTSLLRFLMITMVLAHWLACLWGFVGLQDYVDLDTWENTDGPQEWAGYSAHQSWRHKANVLQAGPWDHYGMALYVALNTIFGGACEISPANFVEFYTQSFMLMLGSSVWAYVIGSACGVIATLDPALIEYRQTLDELNFFVKDQALPQELTIKLRNYFRNTMYLVRARRYDHLLQKMSTRLRGDAAFRMSMNIFGNVPYLIHPDLEPEFMCNLAIKYSISVYSRLERVPCTNLFVVERGVVAKRGRLGLTSACFGKDVILSNNNLRDVGDAIALTFVQTISLTQKDIFDLLPDYPMAYLVIRRAALGMALARALVKAAEIVKKSRLMASGRPICDLFDQAMDMQSNMHKEAEEARQEARREAASSNFPCADGRSASGKEGGDQNTTLFPVKLTEGRSDAVMRALKRGLEASRAAEEVPKQPPSIWGALGGTLKRAPLKLLTTDEKLNHLSQIVEANHTDATKRFEQLEMAIQENSRTFRDGVDLFESFVAQYSRLGQPLAGHVNGSHSPESVRTSTLREGVGHEQQRSASLVGASIGGDATVHGKPVHRKQRPKPRYANMRMKRSDTNQSLAITASEPVSQASCSGGTPRTEPELEHAESSRQDLREESLASWAQAVQKSSPFDA